MRKIQAPPASKGRLARDGRCPPCWWYARYTDPLLVDSKGQSIASATRRFTMPCYVYAVHQDHTGNRSYHESGLNTQGEAQKLHDHMQPGHHHRDNHEVAMFEAEDDAAADVMANGMRSHPRGARSAHVMRSVGRFTIFWRWRAAWWRRQRNSTSRGFE